MRLFLLLLFAFALTAHAQLYEQSVKQVIDALAADSLEKAEGLIQQTLRLDPARESNIILYQYLGEIYQRRGESERAIDAYTKGIGLSPTSTRLLLGRASIYLQINNEGRALGDYSKVLEAEPDNEEALFFRAFIYSQQRKFKEARSDYDRLLKLNPMHEDAMLGLALLNSKDGRPREAMEQIDALVLLYPNHARHYLTRCGFMSSGRTMRKQ